MSKVGLAGTSQETTSAPRTMFQEVEQDEDVARGFVKVREFIAYKATKAPRRYAPEKPGLAGEIKKDKDGSILYVEVAYGPYYCQQIEEDEEEIFKENHPDKRIETFTIQLKKATARRKIDNPENMKQFRRAK